jgi:hypothetical protein
MTKNELVQFVMMLITGAMLIFVFGFYIGKESCQHRQTESSSTTLEQQAALGGAAIPFPSDNPSPTPSNLPQRTSTAGATAASSTNIFEPPSPSSQQADSGQQDSTRYSRPLLRRVMRSTHITSGL